MAVDRKKGGAVNGHCYQKEKSFEIINVYFHALPITEIFDPCLIGQRGWYRIDTGYLTGMYRDPPQPPCVHDPESGMLRLNPREWIRSEPPYTRQEEPRRR